MEDGYNYDEQEHLIYMRMLKANLMLLRARINRCFIRCVYMGVYYEEFTTYSKSLIDKIRGHILCFAG